jgi:antitoxin VapB
MTPGCWYVPEVSAHDLARERHSSLTVVYTPYIFQEMKPIRAKLFQNGGSQAVRLPKAYRFAAQGEVLVSREGRRVILEPADEWSTGFRSCLGSITEEIPRPKQGKLDRIRNPFD